MLPIVLFCIVALWETYLFLAQRSSLEIGRVNDLNPKSRKLMLPIWYLSAWPTILSKYSLAVWIFFDFGILVAIGLLGASFLFKVVIPVPHKHFIPMFERRLLKDISRGDVQEPMHLYSAVQQTKK